MGLKGTIVFSTGEKDLFHVWTYDLSQGEKRQITEGEESFDQPIWSPSGEQIAYLCSREGKSQLCVVRRDGSEPRVIASDTTGDKVYSSPTWTPDGDAVLYQVKSASQAMVEIIRSSVKGEEPGQVIFADAGIEAGMSLTPKGTKLVLSRTREGVTDIVETSLKTGKERQLTSHVAHDLFPRVSPDGKTIAFVSDRDPSGSGILDNFDIWIMARDGLDEPKRLTTNRGADRYVSWSRDGRFLLYCASKKKDADVGAIQVIDLEGNEFEGHKAYSSLSLVSLLPEDQAEASQIFSGKERYPHLF